MKKILLFIFASLIVTHTWAANITGPGSISGNTCIDDNSNCSGGGYEEVMHTVTVTAATVGTWTFSLCNATTTYDSYLALYSGSCIGLLVGNDDFCGSQSEISYTLSCPGTYYLLVSGFSNTDCGAYTLDVTRTPLALPSPAYWIAGNPPVGEGYGTCSGERGAQITDPSGTIYDVGGPCAGATTNLNNVVSVCPEGAGTVTVTINYGLAGGGTIELYDGPSRNNVVDGSTDWEANLTGTGTYTFTTTGPCFSYYSALFNGDAGYTITYTTATSGAGYTNPPGDLCTNPILLSPGTTVPVSSYDATPGAVYYGGAIVDGSCDPNMIVDDGATNCTSTVENTIYMKFTSCSAGGSTTVTLNGYACTPGIQSAQFYVYRGASCGGLTYVTCTTGSTATFTALANTDYYLIVDGFRGNECTWDANVIGCIVAPPACAANCNDALTTGGNNSCPNDTYTDLADFNANYNGDADSGDATCEPIPAGTTSQRLCIEFVATEATMVNTGTTWYTPGTTGSTCGNNITYTNIVLSNSACTTVSTGSFTYRNLIIGDTYVACYDVNISGTFGGDNCSLFSECNALYGVPCAISGITYTPAPPTCVDSSPDYYQVDITVNFTNRPGNGTLDLTGDFINGPFSVAVSSFTATQTSYTFTGVRFPADGTTNSVTAAFSGDAGCTFTLSTLPAVASCSSACPTATTVPNGTGTTCSGATDDLSAWQTAVAAANPSGLVYSSVTPVAGTTLPNGTLPSGTNTGCSVITQTVMAYVYCDVDASGTVNAGDSYTLVSTYTLTVYPAVQAPTVSPSGCAVTITGACAGDLVTLSGAPATGTITNNGTNAATYTAAAGDAAGTLNYSVATGVAGSTCAANTGGAATPACSAVCPTPPAALDDTGTVCDGAGTDDFAAWQTGRSTAVAAVDNASTVSTVEYSTALPTAAVPATGNTTVTGDIPAGCAAVNQTITAYMRCDNGTAGDATDDVWTAIGTYTLTVNPAVQAGSAAAPSGCSVTVTKACSSDVMAASAPTGGASIAKFNATTGVYTAASGDAAGTLTITFSNATGCGTPTLVINTPACAAGCNASTTMQWNP